MTLQHAALETAAADREPLVAFFALLGFKEVQPPGELGERSRWVQRDGTQIHILFADEPVAPPQGHVAVVAPDYDAAMERLRAAGFEPDQRTRHWGAPRCFVRAPGGHRVEVMAAPPPSPRGAGA
jgi:catechol 2,3-dioxygenase-like lactoylglutathione lyase family enzyme